MTQGMAGALYRLFAELLEYPTPALAQHARECERLLAETGADQTWATEGSQPLPGRAQLAALIERFRSFAEQSPLARLEELYTSTFDMQPVCCPYVGYHLFGESYKRGMFMAQLNAGYREAGISAGAELPDHVSVVLRFLALGADGDFSQALLHEGLIPALGAMAQAFGESDVNPYAGVVHALLSLLRDQGPSGLTGKE